MGYWLKGNGLGGEGGGGGVVDPPRCMDDTKLKYHVSPKEAVNVSLTIAGV